MPKRVAAVPLAREIESDRRSIRLSLVHRRFALTEKFAEVDVWRDLISMGFIRRLKQRVACSKRERQTGPHTPGILSVQFRFYRMKISKNRRTLRNRSQVVSRLRQVVSGIDSRNQSGRQLNRVIVIGLVS